MSLFLGRGPVADVYAVAGTALKVFPGRFDRHTLATIERERDKLAGLPVLRTDGVETVEDRHAVRMELCGDSLESRVRRDGPLPAEEVAALCAALSGALTAAHRAGVLHGGVSPTNVLFRTNGRPVLADFGLAQRQAFRRDPMHGIEWVSPETLRTGEVDARTDLYGLGAVLHFALTGQSPHPSRIGENTGERILRVLGDPVPAISRADVPIALSTAIGRLLAPDPANRSAPWTEDVPEVPSPSGRRAWQVALVAMVAAVLAAVLWPRVMSGPPAATGTPFAAVAPPVVNLDEPVDLVDEIQLTWTTTVDRLYTVVFYWVEGEPTKETVVTYERMARVPVEAGLKYCFLVRGTNGDHPVVESQTRAARGADCQR